MPITSILLTILNITIFLVIIFYLYRTLVFYRDPAREIPLGNTLVSPADGKIIDVAEIKNSELDGIKIKKGLFGKIYTLTRNIGKENYMVSIAPGLFDIRINRMPIDGEIEKINSEEGKLLPGKENKGLKNGKTEITIKNEVFGRIKIINIHDFIFKKEKLFVKEKQKILKGQRIGRTNLNGQITLIIPKKANIKVKKGEKVKAGISIIAE